MKPFVALRPLFAFAALFVACSDERTELVDQSVSAIAVPVTEEAPPSCVYQTRIDPPGARKYNLKSHNCPAGSVCPAGGANAAGCTDVRDGAYAETKCACIAAPAACNIAAQTADLASEDFPTREAASAALLDCCTTSEYRSALTTAMNADPSPEVRARLQAVITQCAWRLWACGAPNKQFIASPLSCTSPTLLCGAQTVRAKRCYESVDGWRVEYEYTCPYVWPPTFQGTLSGSPPSGSLAVSCDYPAAQPERRESNWITFGQFFPGFCTPNIINNETTIGDQANADLWLGDHVGNRCPSPYTQTYFGWYLTCF